MELIFFRVSAWKNESNDRGGFVDQITTCIFENCIVSLLGRLQFTRSEPAIHMTYGVPDEFSRDPRTDAPQIGIIAFSCMRGEMIFYFSDVGSLKSSQNSIFVE